MVAINSFQSEIEPIRCHTANTGDERLLIGHLKLPSDVFVTQFMAWLLLDMVDSTPQSKLRRPFGAARPSCRRAIGYEGSLAGQEAAHNSPSRVPLQPALAS